MPRYIHLCKAGTSITIGFKSNINIVLQGLCGQGKSGGKCLFHVGQGISGKVRETCNDQGNSTFVISVKKNCDFIITEVFDLFSLLLKFMVL